MSDEYLGGDPHYAITVMTTMTRVGFEPRVYLGNGNFYSFLTSDIRLYTSAEQRDGDSTSLEPDLFTSGVAVDSGVCYDVPDVPYKPAVVVPFTECPESADPHSIVQDGNVISLRGAQVMSTKVLKIYSDSMEEPELKLIKDNQLEEEMDIKQGHKLWKDFCEDKPSDPQLPPDLGSLYEAITKCEDPTSIKKVLEISRRFREDPTVTNEVTEHPHLLYRLATNGYAGGELLRIPLSAGMALMEDKAFDKLFNREDSDAVPSRNALQHAIHQNAELAIQVRMVGYILQEVSVDVIYQHYEAVLPILLEIKLLYQQRRIREYRLEPYRPIQNIRKGQPRISGGTQSKGEALWKQWQKERLGLSAVDTDNYLDH